MEQDETFRRLKRLPESDMLEMLYSNSQGSAAAELGLRIRQSGWTVDEVVELLVSRITNGQFSF